MCQLVEIKSNSAKTIYSFFFVTNNEKELSFFFYNKYYSWQDIG